MATAIATHSRYVTSRISAIKVTSGKVFNNFNANTINANPTIIGIRLKKYHLNANEGLFLPVFIKQENRIINSPTKGINDKKY